MNILIHGSSYNMAVETNCREGVVGDADGTRNRRAATVCAGERDTIEESVTACGTEKAATVIQKESVQKTAKRRIGIRVVIMSCCI